MFQQFIQFTASPQVASSSAGDCAFEDDMCGWTNPGRADGLDEINWERLEAARGEPRFPQVYNKPNYCTRKICTKSRILLLD